MTDRTRRWLLYGALIALFALHNDLWLWDDTRRVLGLPVGLLYHVTYCLVASLLLAAVVRWAWPSFGDELVEEGPDPDRTGSERAEASSVSTREAPRSTEREREDGGTADR